MSGEGAAVPLGYTHVDRRRRGVRSCWSRPSVNLACHSLLRQIENKSSEGKKGCLFAPVVEGGVGPETTGQPLVPRKKLKFCCAPAHRGARGGVGEFLPSTSRQASRVRLDKQAAQKRAEEVAAVFHSMRRSSSVGVLLLRLSRSHRLVEHTTTRPKD